MTSKFSGYPFDRLRQMTRAEAARESVVARWIGARSDPRGELGPRLAKLVGAVGGTIGARVIAVGASSDSFDRYAAHCEVRIAGAAFTVRGASAGIRVIAQRMVGGRTELTAPRPLTVVEESLFCLVVATALEDLGVAGEVWSTAPLATTTPIPTKATKATPPTPPTLIPTPSTIALTLELATTSLSIEIIAPGDLDLRAPPTRIPAWADASTIDVSIVLGRCAIAAADLDRLALRSVITLERPAGSAELEILGGRVGLRAGPSAMVAEVMTGYLPRDMSLPDDAHVELTVVLGTTQLSLRQVFELAIGQVVPLGRPLAGPFELRAAGRVLGKGELVDVDGELAVRIVSLGD